MSDDPFHTLRIDALVRALAGTAFAGVEPPRDDAWQPMASAPADETPVWSRNALMGEPVISSRHRRREVHVVLAAPFDAGSGVGGRYVSDRWQPLVFQGDRA